MSAYRKYAEKVFAETGEVLPGMEFKPSEEKFLIRQSKVRTSDESKGKENTGGGIDSTRAGWYSGPLLLLPGSRCLDRFLPLGDKCLQLSLGARFVFGECFQALRVSDTSRIGSVGLGTPPVPHKVEVLS